MLHPVRRGDAMGLMASIERLRGRGGGRRGREGGIPAPPCSPAWYEARDEERVQDSRSLPPFSPFLPSPYRSEASSGVVVVQSRATSGQGRSPLPFPGEGRESDTKVRKENGGPDHRGMPSSRSFVRPSFRFAFPRLLVHFRSPFPHPLPLPPLRPTTVCIRRAPTARREERKRDPKGFCTYIQGLTGGTGSGGAATTTSGGGGLLARRKREGGKEEGANTVAAFLSPSRPKLKGRARGCSPGRAATARWRTGTGWRRCS